MSAKSTKKPQGKKLSLPRELQAIQQEYQQLMMRAGQLQYEISVKKKELESVNERSVIINNEASARLQLDKEESARKEALKTEEKPVEAAPEETKA